MQFVAVGTYTFFVVKFESCAHDNKWLNIRAYLINPILLGFALFYPRMRLWQAADLEACLLQGVLYDN